MPPLSDKTPGRAYWRSLGELCDSPEFRERLEKEFPHLLPEGVSPSNRRRFLKLMGASLALAGVTGCNNPSWPRWPKTQILPYAFRPEGRTPGAPRYFATSLEIAGAARPLLAESYDGRPIKLEGNPEHPASGGGADLIAQASILGLYDPDRSRGVARFPDGRDSEHSWDEFLEDIRPGLEQERSGGGSGIRILSEASSSPSLAAVRERFLEAFPAAHWHEYESISRDNEREGARLAFGQALRTHYALENASVIVSLDDDLLMTHPAAVAHTKAFAKKRRPEAGEMCRLYAVESSYSITGSVADHRYATAAGTIPRIAWSLAAHLVLDEGLELPAAARSVRDLLPKARGHGEHGPLVKRIAKDLLNHRGHGLITVGPGQPASVHALAQVLNEALGNRGSTVKHTAEAEGDRASHVESLTDLVDAMNRNRVKTLFILGGNPAFDAPADLDFATALARVRHSAHLSSSRDETSRGCSWHLPRAHYLEAWSDARTHDGTYTLAQPLLEPLFGGRTPAELLASLVDGRDVPGLELVRSTFGGQFGSDARPWKRAVHDGFVASSAPPSISPPLSAGWRPTESDFAASSASGAEMELVFLQDYRVFDGRFANNGWLQEMPDPMTKLSWDNAALINPLKARDLGIDEGDLLELRRGERTITAPAHLLPGQAMNSIAISLGHGRRSGGRIAEGSGFDASGLRTTDAMSIADAVEVRPTGERYELATTQDHHAINNKKQGEGQAERLPELFRETTLDEFEKHPDFAQHLVHHPPLKSLWNEHDYGKGHQWGMSIDLSSCTGCGACVIACQAENNIPIVGKKEVSHGREMHWIRVDRYFKGSLEAPEVGHQVVTCHHCENAPCEQVCPVAATVHNSEGLNDMVYNRCVGTRYCSNNCPYKVRRFNWFNNTRKPYNDVELFQMQRNPDVTVRARGVMEKCSYCIQRIKAVTIPAKNEQRAVADGEIVPACAQTCPADAIVFGDLNDPKSRVRKLQEAERSYAMLAELNIKPRTKYLAKIRNPGNGGGDSSSHDAHSGDPGHGSEG